MLTTAAITPRNNDFTEEPHIGVKVICRNSNADSVKSIYQDLGRLWRGLFDPAHVDRVRDCRRPARTTDFGAS